MECLIDRLEILKESSQEAVETLEKPSEFKKYMHIEREIEHELYKIIKKSSELEKCQLILVCGGVGDGKSHIISHLKNKYSDIFKNFDLHNDATESDEPHLTAMQTLNKKFQPYSDENIDSTITNKLIVAINLGTLNNFLNSEFGESYKKLKKYVEENNIFGTSRHSNNFDENSKFHYVNFSDYYLYTLTEKGPKSIFLETLLEKVFLEEPNNPFYKAYNNTCYECDLEKECPVKYNYEYMKNLSNRSLVINLLIEIMIKYRTIMSTRSILNFIFEVLVCSKIDSISPKQRKKRIEKLNSIDRIKALTSVLMFENEKQNDIFNKLSLLDPLSKRLEILDNEIIKLNTTKELSGLVEKNELIGIDSYIKNLILKNKGSNDEIVKYIVRNIKPEGGSSDKIYKEYLTYLYDVNKNESRSKRNEIYKKVVSGIHSWNGGNKNDESFGIFPGKKQLKYKITQELKITPSFDNESREESEFFKFIPYLSLHYKIDREKLKPIEVDYFLYELLEKISEGYKPNSKDRSNFIKFDNEIKKISKYGNKNDSLKVVDQLNKYKFEIITDEYDTEFYEFSELR